MQTETLDQCPICGSRKLNHLLVAPDFESHTGSYGIDECLGCGVGLTNPRPIEAELPGLYEQRSTADFPHMDGFVQRLRDFAIDRYLARQLDATPGSGDATFEALDYGCGDGALTRGLIRLARLRSCPIHVTAVDFHDTAPSALANAGKLASYQSNSSWHAQPGHYDAIFARHVLEHHPQPLRLLANFRAALRPNGRLYIEVPNRRSVWARVFGRHYSGYYLPRHLIHFEHASLRSAILSAGFRSVDIHLGHTPLIGHSIGYLTGLNIGNTGLLGLVTYPAQVCLDVFCRTSTTLRATAIAHG